MFQLYNWTSETQRCSNLCLSCTSKLSNWCVKILLLPMSLLQKDQKALCTNIINITSVCHWTSERFVLYGATIKTKNVPITVVYRLFCWNWQDEESFGIGGVWLFALIIHFPVMSLSGMHQGTFAFTIQNLCADMHHRMVVYTCI